MIDNVSDDPGIEDGTTGGNTALLLKSAANANFRSTLVIVNPNDAALSVTVVAREGSPLNNGAVTETRTVQIPGNGMFVSEIQDLGAGNAFGPVEIRSSSGLPIIAVSRVYSQSSNTSGFLEGAALP